MECTCQLGLCVLHGYDDRDGQALQPHHMTASRCHRDPGEVLDCRRGTGHEGDWTHTKVCSEAYFEGLSIIEFASVRS
jgi:hypothetical protein